MGEEEKTRESQGQKTIDESKKQKALHEAEKARLDAKKALHESQKALKDAETSAAVAELQKQKALADAEKALLESRQGLANSQKLSELKNRKAIADAGKALLEARNAMELAESGTSQDLADLEQQKKLAEATKALADSQTQAALATHIGATKAGAFQGSVTVQDKAGNVESRLLAAHAVKKAAKKIAKSVKGKANRFFLFDADTFPEFQHLQGFKFRLQLIKQAYEAVGITSAAPEVLEGAAIPAAVSAGLEALSNILGYLKTDYTIQGVDVSLDNSLLLFSVAGALSECSETQLPMVHNAFALDETANSFAAQLDEHEYLRRQAVERMEAYKSSIASLKKQAEAAEGEEKQHMLASATADGKLLKQLADVVKSYNDLLTSLVKADSDGKVPLTTLLLEFALDSAMTSAKQGGAVLLLRLENSGGGYLMKKNLWTGLGSMPLWHMGGSTVAYLLLDGADGKVLGGDVLPIHGGFIKSGKLEAHLEQGP